MQYIIDEIDADNMQDVENTHKKEKYPAKFDINMQCHDVEPDAKVRNTKLDFHKSEFWFIKGFDHYHAKSGNEIESAVDSYRQAIRIQPFFIDAIHNLACSY